MVQPRQPFPLTSESPPGAIAPFESCKRHYSLYRNSMKPFYTGHKLESLQNTKWSKGCDEETPENVSMCFPSKKNGKREGVVSARLLSVDTLVCDAITGLIHTFTFFCLQFEHDLILSGCKNIVFLLSLFSESSPYHLSSPVHAANFLFNSACLLPVSLR